MQFRRVEKNEIGALSAFAKETFIHTYAHLNNPEYFKNYIKEAFSISKITAEWQNPNSHYYWKKEEDIPVAYIKLNEEAAQTDQCLHSSLEIERIYVDPRFKRRGLGSSMINHAIGIASTLKLEWIWLGVWKKNPGAIQFYQKHGFEIFSEHIFTIGEDHQLDYLMRRKVI